MSLINSEKKKKPQPIDYGKVTHFSVGQKNSYHFVGIGGCGMSALAQLLKQQGHQVTGSDQQSSDVIDRLQNLGIDVTIGHQAENLDTQLDVLVLSAAVKPENPEWMQAHQRQIKIVKYAQLLGELSKEIPTFAVAGTHGKSTTSGWLTYTLQRAGCEPGFVVGADVGQLGCASSAGQGQHLIVEACEYDRSFLNLHPSCAGILNIEQDHMDYYRDLDDICDAFGAFIDQLGREGVCVANKSDANLMRTLSGKPTRVDTYSLREQADWSAGQLEMIDGYAHFNLMHSGYDLGKVACKLPGWHNASNALAVAAMAHHAGLVEDQIIDGLNHFTGVHRRLTLKGRLNDVTILDDYAHHPTEIQVTLDAIQAAYQPKRLWCIFQPHQHSRTRFLLDDFATSFRQADRIILPEIYFVRDSEKECREINAEALAEKIRENGGHCDFLSDFQQILDMLQRELCPGDIVVTMGAGDIWKIADELIYRLR